jgi:ribosomal protein S13
MLRLLNRNARTNIRLGPFLKTFYGVGFRRSLFVTTRLGVKYRSKFSKLPDYIKKFITTNLSFFTMPNPSAERIFAQSISFKIRNGSYQGFCISNNIPSRGQRSKKNGKTAQKGLIPLLIKKYNLLIIVF